MEEHLCRTNKIEIMKKIILMFAVVAIASASIFAQESKSSRKSPEERTEKIIEKMKTDLILTDDQVSKLKPVILKREQQREALRAEMNAGKEDQKKIAREAEEDLKKILTPEQMEKLKQQRKEMREKHKHQQN